MNADILTSFSDDLGNIRLPRWNDLPDIELYMDQVITLMNKYINGLYSDGGQALTSSMINNYVKLGIVPCPVKKKYSRTQLSRLIIICVLKPVLSIQSIGTLIDILLKTRTEEEMLDCFAENYETVFSKITEYIRSSFDEMKNSGGQADAIVTSAIMRAAAVSGCGKLFAEKALSSIADSKNNAANNETEMNENHD